MVFQPVPPCRVGATINLHEQVRKAHWSTTKGLQVRMERTPAEIDEGAGGKQACWVGFQKRLGLGGSGGIQGGKP